ncbi:meiosis-specific coiled-coil domain-containing protein MEIOC-like [Oenanthe melanoleuca]|uniref:meiosis-specific coiled-coil domain-containing protein MEIOC-like n=1 Tax=Oenanthe melanoleuca TaxID=2939378 RepID=UPI0024C1FB67|nr:meiosis-specific coiled-coil domain-containing protein MEIOC-like [Oenanthe melanoleuca]
MDTQFFSPLLGAVPSPPTPPEPSQVCSDWLGCAEDFGSQNAFQECPKKRASVNLSYSGSGPDMFGLVSSILEEPNKPEAATDWNSLSGLFPPVWAPALGSSGEFPAQPCVQNKDFPNLLGTSCQQEPLQEPPDVEMLHRGLGDLQLLESWLSHPSSAPRKAHPENPSLHSSTTAPQEGFSFPNQNLCTYDHGRLKHGSSFSPFSPRNRVKESPNVQEFWKSERARGKALKNYAQGQINYSPDLSNQPGDNPWDKIPQDSHLCSKRYGNFTAAHKLESSVHPSLHFFHQLPKENDFPGGADRKPQEFHVQNGHRGFAVGNAFNNNNNNQCKVNMGPKESSPQVAEYDLSVKNAVQNGTYSSYQGCVWLDGKSLAAAPEIPYGKQMATSPQSSSGVSTMSGGSPTHQPFPQPSFYSQLLPACKDGSLHTSSGVPSRVGAPHVVSESQEQVRAAGRCQGMNKERRRRKFPAGASPHWLLQQRAAGEDPAEKYHRFPKRQSQESGSKEDRRGRRNWIPPLGSAAPSRQPFVFPKKHNGGSLSDFINPSLLPSFPFMSDFRQNPSFPPLNHQLLSSAKSFHFPPPPFPFSDLADLLHCDDFTPLAPLISDLLPGEIPGPCFAFPAPFHRCRAPRSHSGPSTELHIHLEECYEQGRALERERRKAEAELARHFPGQLVPSPSPVPQLPVTPSRVDRLIVEQRRQRARVLALIAGMERLRGAPVHRNIARTLELHLEAIQVTQARRKEEIGNAVNPQSHGVPRYSNEKGVLALAAALAALAGATRRARTALWCALQVTLPKSPPAAPQHLQLLQGPLQQLCSSSTQEKSSVEHGGRGSEEAEEARKVLE